MILKGVNNPAFKHGYSLTNNRHPLYNVWKSIKQRCLNPKNADYKDYGMRSITICDEWKSNPKSFMEWGISHGYQKGLYIDRINNNGNYSPENCRFVTAKVSASNKRSQRKKSNLPIGVCKNGNGFNSSLYIEGKKYYLGYFHDIDSASKCYSKCKEAFIG